MLQLLPAIDIRGGRCVRLRQGNYDDETVFSDSPVEMALRWKEQGAERLHLVDLDGAREGRPVNHDVARAIAESAGIPCQLGGGIRSEESVAACLDVPGLDRVILGSRALKEPDWFRSVCERYPGKAALGLDARNSYIATEGWLETGSVSAIDLAAQFTDVPLAAVIYTNIANDGMMQGIDAGTLEDFRKLADLGLPVIASGGVTGMEDLAALKSIHQQNENLVGAITGRAIYEGAIAVDEAIRFLREDG